MKIIPVIGSIILVGTFVQIWLGYTVSGGAINLRDAHSLIGYIGLAFAAILTYVAWTRATATRASQIAMSLLLILVIAQVWLGIQVLGGYRGLLLSHEYTAFAIAILVVAQSAITSIASRRRRGS